MEENEMMIDLSELFDRILHLLLRTWKIGVLFLVLAVAASVAYVHVTYKPIYETKMSFAVSRELNGEKTYQYNKNAADELATSFESILHSDVMMEAMQAELGSDTLPAEMTASRIGTTNLFTIFVRDGNPENVSKVMNAFLNNYAKVFRATLMDINLDIIENPEKAYIYNAPEYGKYILYAALAVLVLYGMILAVWAFFRKTVTEEEDIREWLRTPCLGTIPYVQATEKKKMPLITADGSRYAELKDAVGSIRRRIEREKEKEGAVSFLFTGAAEGEGTSTVVNNVALSLAYKGYHTAIVELTREANRKGKDLGEEQGEKRPEIKVGNWTFQAEVSSLTKKLHFYYPTSSEDKQEGILGSPVVGQFLKALSNKYDYILLDVPAIMKTADTLSAAQMADTSVMIIKEDKTAAGTLIDAMEMLNQATEHILGCVINGSKNHVSRYGYGYGYGYRYGYGYGYGYRKYGYGKKEKSGKKQKEEQV